MNWITLSLLAALCFGLRGVLYHWTSQKKLDRDLMLCGVFFSGFIISLAFGVFNGLAMPNFAQVIVGSGMGVFSYSANAALFKGYSVGKASLVSVLAGLPPVFVVLMAYIFWGESLTGLQLLSFFVIIVGINLIRYSNDLSLKDLKGAHWGLLAALFFGLNDIMGKQSTRLDSQMFMTLILMFGVGSLLFFIGWFKSTSQHETIQTFFHRTQLRTFSIGLLVGLTNVGGMVTILPAFDLGPTAMVSVIAALNLLVVLFYTRFILKFPFRGIELIGIFCAFSGLLLLRLV